MSMRTRPERPSSAWGRLAAPSTRPKAGLAFDGQAIRRIAALILALWTAAALAPAATAASRARASGRHACCHVAAGTPVRVELVDQVSSAVQKRGDTFALRLAAPLIVNGRVVLRPGAPGVGAVIEATGPGIGGKPAEMVLAASYLTTRRGRIPLNAMQLARPGHDNSAASQVLGLSGIAFAPLGFVGIALPGGEVVFRPGTVATAKVASDLELPALGRATRGAMAAAAASAADDAALDVAGAIAIAPPPPGQGQVIFFRPKSIMGTGQWFNVREDGQALGKLTNGAYFIQVTRPGIHTYTAVLEPELKDHLKLSIDAGETYFVQGTLTGGLVIGAADLSPSSRAKFNKAAKHLKLAAPPASDRAADQSPAPATDPATPKSDAPQAPRSMSGSAVGDAPAPLPAPVPASPPSQ